MNPEMPDNVPRYYYGEGKTARFAGVSPFALILRS